MLCTFWSTKKEKKTMTMTMMDTIGQETSIQHKQPGA